MKPGAAILVLSFILTGCGAGASTSTTRSVTTKHRRTTASADSYGQNNAPCAGTFTLRHGVLTISVVSQDPGELVIEPVVNGTERSGKIERRDLPHITAGRTVVRFPDVHSAPQIPIVLYTSSSPNSAMSCSVVRKGDPTPHAP